MTVQRVSALINRIGQTITYQRAASNDYDVATGINTVTTETVSVKASIRNFKLSERLYHNEIKVGDREVIIAGLDLSFTPKKDDKVIANGQTLAVLAVEQRNLRDGSAMYVLQARGA